MQLLAIEMSRFDHLYRSLLLSKFFTKGWGNPENLKRLFDFRKVLSNRDTCYRLVEPDYPVYIDKDVVVKNYRIVEGHFLSPFTKHLPGVMPKEVQQANFQVILPLQWKTRLKPVCLHLAGTGDHYFWRRRILAAKPLLKEAGIASILLENPYYGTRKPKQQRRSSLLNVSDLFVMGGALVLESMVLFHWCERQGYGPLGITGVSMGGHMASIAASNWPKPIVLVPCLSWSTASCVFTQGVMSGAIPWRLLQEQYYNNRSFGNEVSRLIESPEEKRDSSAFQLGRDFSRNYPNSLKDLSDVHEELNRQLHKPSLTVPHKQHCADRSSPGDVSNRNDITQCSVDPLRDSSSSNRSRFKPKTFSSVSLAERLSSFFLKHASQETAQQEAINFMRGVMDECTHLGNFSIPVDTNLVIMVTARSDAYVPRESVLSIEELWPGTEVRYIDTGHIAAFLFKQDVFRKAIVDAFQRKIQKYYS